MLYIVQVRHPHFSIDLKMDMDETYVPDYNTLLLVRNDGCPEIDVLEVMYRTLRGGDVAIDGGANIGFMSLLMASMVGNDGKVFAFEPGDDNLKKLRTNIDLNHAFKIEVIDQPLWKSSGLLLPFYFNKDSGQHSFTQSDETIGETKKVTAHIDAFGLSPRLIKLDIEGAELQAIKGAVKTIARCKPFIICEINARDEEALNSLRDYMYTLGYDMYALYIGMAMPTFVPRKTRIVSRFKNTNVLFATEDLIAESWPELVYAAAKDKP